MSIDIYCLLTIDLFCPSFIESASKVNVEYCHPWALISCLHDKFKFQSTLQHDVAPNLWKFWPVVSPAHPCLFHLIVSRWGLRIKLCIFTNIWDLIPLSVITNLLALTHLRVSICTVQHIHCVYVCRWVDERVSGASLPCSTACLRVSAQSVSQPNPSLSPCATTQQEDL